jgi:hypothetical protein
MCSGLRAQQAVLTTPTFTRATLSLIILPFQTSANASLSITKLARPVSSPPNCLAGWVLTLAQIAVHYDSRGVKW